MASVFESEVALLGFTAEPLPAFRLKSPDGDFMIIVCNATVSMYSKDVSMDKPANVTNFGSVWQAHDAALRIAKGWLIAQEKC